MTEQRPARPWSRYAQSVHIVVRAKTEPGDESIESAVGADFIEVEVDLPLEDFVPQAEAWLAERRGDFFDVEIRRTYRQAGASSVGALLVITILGTAVGTPVGLALYDVLSFARERLLPGKGGGGKRLESLRSLDPDDAGARLAAAVARAIDCRRSDLSLVEFALDEDEARAVYEVGDHRYEVGVDESAYRIARVEPTEDA